MDNLKEVRFDIYCKDCEYAKLSENENPCWDCLNQPVNVNSRKPIEFKEKSHK